MLPVLAHEGGAQDMIGAGWIGPVLALGIIITAVIIGNSLKK